MIFVATCLPPKMKLFTCRGDEHAPGRFQDLPKETGSKSPVGGATTNPPQLSIRIQIRFHPEVERSSPRRPYTLQPPPALAFASPVLKTDILHENSPPPVAKRAATFRFIAHQALSFYHNFQGIATDVGDFLNFFKENFGEIYSHILCKFTKKYTSCGRKRKKHHIRERQSLRLRLCGASSLYTREPIQT